MLLMLENSVLIIHKMVMGLKDMNASWPLERVARLPYHQLFYYNVLIHASESR